jgi:predicted phosphodiesterase
MTSKGAWAEGLSETELFNGVYVYAILDLSQLDMEPSAARVHLVVSGHSHKTAIERREGVVYVNPGSAGPRRFRLPVTVAEVAVIGGQVTASIVELEAASAA